MLPTRTESFKGGGIPNRALSLRLWRRRQQVDAIASADLEMLELAMRSNLLTV